MNSHVYMFTCSHVYTAFFSRKDILLVADNLIQSTNSLSFFFMLNQYEYNMLYIRGLRKVISK